jgi:segregation and condensation protein A
LVRECRIELAEIPIAPICVEYATYLRETGYAEIDCAATGMFGLAYLVERKAWGMMPDGREPEEPDGLDALSSPTAATYGPAIDQLLAGKEERDLLYFREFGLPTGHYELPRDLSGIRTEDLVAAFRRLLERARPDTAEELRTRHVSMAELILRARQVLGRRDGVLFEQLLPQNFTRLDVVWTFLAMLEMIRLGLCRVTLKEESLWVWAPRKD